MAGIVVKEEVITGSVSIKEDEGTPIVSDTEYVQILVGMGNEANKTTYEDSDDHTWRYHENSNTKHSSEYFLVANVGKGVNEVQISDYTGPNGVQWDLTVDEYVQDNSEGGVDTYPTFQPVNRRRNIIEHRIFTQTTRSGKIALGFQTSEDNTQYYLTPEASSKKIRTTKTNTPQYVFIFK